MHLRNGYRLIGLLCGLLLVLPAAHAKKPQDEDNEWQRSERTAKQRGQQPQEAPRNNRSRERQYDNRGYAPQYERRPAPQPRYNNDYNRNYERRDSAPARRYEYEPRYAPRGMNLSEAVAEAERRTGGRVLSAEPLDENGQVYYRVKVLTPNGRVKVLFLDQ